MTEDIIKQIKYGILRHVTTENQAREIIQQLEALDWNTLVKESERKKKEEQVICPICNQTYSPAQYGHISNGMCLVCKKFREKETFRLRIHISRARVAGLEHTLTYDQWMATLDYFNKKCAYCGTAYEIMEHFIPITLGGGTTASNCIPACKRCNILKSNSHPDQVTHFKQETINQIKYYLSTCL